MKGWAPLDDSSWGGSAWGVVPRTIFLPAFSKAETWLRERPVMRAHMVCHRASPRVKGAPPVTKECAKWRRSVDLPSTYPESVAIVERTASAL